MPQYKAVRKSKRREGELVTVSVTVTQGEYRWMRDRHLQFSGVLRAGIHERINRERFGGSVLLAGAAAGDPIDPREPLWAALTEWIRNRRIELGGNEVSIEEFQAKKKELGL